MLSSNYYTAVAGLVQAQFSALTDAPEWAGDSEGYEEFTGCIDIDATLARIERHRAQSDTVQAKWEAYVVEAIDAMKLANFSGDEVVAVHKRVHRSGVRNQLPTPRQLLHVMYGLVIDQRVRDEVGALRLTSLVRSTDYNRAVGGKSASRHLVGDAKDRVPLRASVADLARVDDKFEGKRIALTFDERVAIARHASTYSLAVVGGEIVVGGGLGIYRRSGFVHRDNRGKRARWNG